MTKRIVEWSLRNPVLVFFLWGLIAIGGLFALARLPIDAVPDVTNVQVQIFTSAPALSPVEVESFLTLPVERAMSGIPDVEEIRSISRFGLSAVTVVFAEDTPILRARQHVQERLQIASEEIPEQYGKPEMGPISTGLGEIYQFEVKGDGSQSLMELRNILEWIVTPRLRSVPGVVEVNSFGGELQTYQVALDPTKLQAYGLGVKEVFEALEGNNVNAGGAYIERGGEQFLIRGLGLYNSIPDIENTLIAVKADHTPILIKNVGDVRLAPMVRQGAVTRDGRGEVVTGVVMMLAGANSREVVEDVKVAVEEIRDSLPKGVTIDTFYDRTDLVSRTISTVRKNLIEGGILVIAVLLLALGNLRGGFIVATAIPLSMLVAFTGMVMAGVSGNLMSLGALDFGLIVDGAVVMVENVLRSANHAKNRADWKETVREACGNVSAPVAFAIIIIAVVYFPILSLQGIEGKMFRPMAATVIFALAGALALTLTLVPVLAALFLRNAGHEESETWLIRKLRALYTPILDRTMRHRLATFGVAAGLFTVSIGIAFFMGAEFIPKLDEGAIAIGSSRLPSTSLEESVRQTTVIEKVLLKLPEVKTVVSKTGRPEIATDPMGTELSDIFVILKDHDDWRKGIAKEELIAEMENKLEQAVPGNVFSFSQPIELRVAELISGTRADVAITLYGDDLDTLVDTATRISRTIGGIQGAADVKVERQAGLPNLNVRLDRAKLARLGISAEDALNVIETVGGKTVGTVFEGQRRFDLQVRFKPEFRGTTEDIGVLRVSTPEGALVPLSEVATLTEEDGPAQINRDKIRRRINVEVNVRGRDLASFVAEAQRAVKEKVEVPAGYFVEWGGQFKNLASAGSRLLVAVPLAILLIFILLQTAFRSVRMALLIMLNVPFAVVGGVFSLLIRGMPLSISAAVGFIALFGVAVLNGVVLVSYIERRRQDGLGSSEAAVEGAGARFRPVLTTAFVAALGFIPMALAHGSGAEVQRPLATVVIGGLMSSTALTLLVIPTVYAWFAPRHATHSQEHD